jgi:Family of unknown function (DUF5681)
MKSRPDDRPTRPVARSVGYGNPPRAHQFKPGQSGNRRGRPKGRKNNRTLLRQLLERKVELRERGKLRKITIREAILLRFIEDALRGNTKAATFLFNRDIAEQQNDEVPTDATTLSTNEREILDEFVAQIKGQLKPRSKK